MASLDFIVGTAVASMISGDGTNEIAKYIQRSVAELKEKHPEQVTRETVEQIMGRARGAVDTVAQTLPHLV